MLFEVNDGVFERLHGKAVRTDDAALGHVAVLNVERARRTGREHVAGVPALDARVQGNELCGTVGHVCNNILCIDRSVEDALHLELQHIGHLVGRDELGTEGEERREVLDNGQITGVPGNEFVALEDGFLGHIENGRVADDGALPVLLRDVAAVASHDDAQLCLRRGFERFLEPGEPNLVARTDEGVRHFKEAAGESGGRGVADVGGVVGIVQPDAENAPGVAVQRGVDDPVGRNDAGNGLQLFLSAVVVPAGQTRNVIRLNEAHHILLPAGAFGGVERGDGQNAPACDDAGDLRAVQLDGGKSHGGMSPFYYSERCCRQR